MAWQTTFLRIAGAYNLAWAVLSIVWPEAVVGWLGLREADSALLWRCLGMSSGVMGVGYLLAASDVKRHWPIVLMGLLGKIGSGAALSWSILSGKAGTEAWTWVVVDDVLWLAPLGAILYSVYESVLGHKRCMSGDILRLALRRKTQDGLTLDELSRLSPVLLVFLRHTGCTFCREALADLSAKRAEIEANGAQLVLVHMSTEETAAKFFAKYGLQNAQRISDPEKTLYRAFGLPRGSFGDLFGPKVWIRGFQAGILGRHGVGMLDGDGFQMPGAFLLYFGEVLRSYRHQSAADRPNYIQLVTGHSYASPEVSS